MCYIVVFVSLCILKASCEQRFLESPVDTEVIDGSTCVLNCQVENPVGLVQWTRNAFGLGYHDRSLPNFPRYTMTGSEHQGINNLMISNACLEDDGLYECQVMATDTTPLIRTKPARVNVIIAPDPPTITGGPIVEVIANSPTNISCVALNGKPYPQMIWSSGGEVINGSYENITPLSAGKRQNITSSLAVTLQRTDEGKEYTCDVWNKALLTQHLTVTAAVTVLFAPEVTMSVSPEGLLREYQSVRFVCLVKAKPTTIKWKWYKDDVLLEGEVSGTLRINTLSRTHHESVISCEAENSVGSQKKQQTISVQYGPQFTAEAEHVAVDLSDSATLRCSVDSNPTPAIVWYRKGDRAHILSSSNEYTINSVTETHIGVYTCHVSVSGFEHAEMEVHLIKKDAPRVISDTTQFAHFGETGRLVCDTVSIPLPDQMLWVYRDQIIEINKPHSPKYHLTQVDGAFGRRSELEIDGIDERDFTEYNCTAINSYGSHSVLISLKRTDVVPIAYILSGVLGGIVLVIVVTIVVFVCHRKKTASDDSSDASSGDITKGQGDSNTQLTLGGGNPPVGRDAVDAWNQEAKLYHNPSVYDVVVPRRKEISAPFDVYPDPYGPQYGPAYGPNYGYDYGANFQEPHTPYGTLDRPYSRQDADYHPASHYAPLPTQEPIYPPSVHEPYPTHDIYKTNSMAPSIAPGGTPSLPEGSLSTNV